MDDVLTALVVVAVGFMIIVNWKQCSTYSQTLDANGNVVPTYLIPGGTYSPACPAPPCQVVMRTRFPNPLCLLNPFEGI